MERQRQDQRKTNRDRDKQRQRKMGIRDRERQRQKDRERGRETEKDTENERDRKRRGRQRDSDGETETERRRMRERDRDRDTQRDRERQTGRGGGEWVEKEIITIVPGTKRERPLGSPRTRFESSAWPRAGSPWVALCCGPSEGSPWHPHLLRAACPACPWRAHLDEVPALVQAALDLVAVQELGQPTLGVVHQAAGVGEERGGPQGAQVQEALLGVASQLGRKQSGRAVGGRGETTRGHGCPTTVRAAVPAAVSGLELAPPTPTPLIGAPRPGGPRLAKPGHRFPGPL